MQLFRSEEHLERWLDGRPPGATTSVATLCDLAHGWWSDRLSPDWRPHTRDHNQAILERVGLTGAFWRLPGPTLGPNPVHTAPQGPRVH